MPRLACALFALVMSAGCGGKATCPPAAPTPPVPEASTDPVTVRVKEYEAAMCACKTATCGADVEAGIEAWAEEHQDELKAAFADRLRSAQLEGYVDRGSACKDALPPGGEASPGPTDADAVIAAFRRLTDEMCGCKDQACAERVLTEMKDLRDPGDTPTEAQMQEAMKIAEKMSACQKALMPDEDPPAPDPADTPPDPRIRPPVAADLAGYLKGIKGLKAKGTLTATIDTNLGSFHCALYEKQTPITVANFVGLATGQKPWLGADGKVVEGVPLYDGLRFHRVIPDFMIQGGDPKDDGSGGPGYAFADEVVDSLHLDAAGVLAMANAGPATNGSQFFITAKETPWLDGKHTVFGRCKEVDLVGKITALSGAGDRPTRPVVITRVTISRK
jgi:peptidyl-prolyl cis-trans isomerase A (cyclophilin A)